MAKEYDVLIKNASIIDGSGKPPFESTIALNGDRIEAIDEKVKGDAKTIIDAKGFTLTPGFIDVHNHADLSVLYYPECQSFLSQGITTFIGGNCGDTPGPYGDYISEPWFLCDVYDYVSPHMYYRSWILPRDLVNRRHRELYGWEIDWVTMGEFFKKVEKNGLSPNYFPLVGHGDVRAFVMGPDYKRKATIQEVKKMQEQVKIAMEEGCHGLSVGRDYEPGFWADIEELVACAKVVKKYGGIYTSHCLNLGPMRTLKPGERPSAKTNGVIETLEVGRRCKIPVQVSHLGPLYDVYPSDNKGVMEASIKATLRIIDEARQEGINVNFDIIPNHLAGGIFTSSWLVNLLIPWMKIAGSPENFSESLKMKDFRQDIKDSIDARKWFMLDNHFNPDWKTNRTIVDCKEAKYLKKTIMQIASESKIEPLDALMDILALDPYTKATRQGDDDSAKLMFFAHPEMMIGVDTFAVDDKFERKYPPWYLPNENSYGGFPRYFRRAVKEAKILSLEEAVRKVTSLPAKKFGLNDRGVIREKAYADIVIMNPDELTDCGSQLDPRRYPKGIEYVIVNGVVVVEKGKHNLNKPGKILYRKNIE